MPRLWLFLTLSSFQLFQMCVFFQTKLHGGENPAFPAVSGSRLSTEGLAPWSTHQPPSKLHGCSKLDPSFLTRSDRYPSLSQPPPWKKTLKRVFLPFLSLQGENIPIFLQIIVNLLQPPAKACRDSSQNQFHKNDTFSATFSGLSLEPFFFPPTCLANKACMSPFIIKKQSGPFSKAETCISPFGFQKILPKHATVPHPLHQAACLHQEHRSPDLPSTLMASSGTTEMANRSPKSTGPP